MNAARDGHQPRTHLEELSIRSLGVIDDAVLPLGPGFTAITGETGAGKTMVVQALALLRGQRADAGLIRSGAERAAVQGVWILGPDAAIDDVLDAGGVVEDGELLVGRSVSREGRSRAQIGGANVPAATLQSLADQFVTVHGQSDQQRLRSTDEQRAALDRAAGGELVTALERYRAHRTAWAEANATLAGIVAEREARLSEAAALRQDLDEIAALDPQPGEDEELQQLAHRLEHVESLRASVGQAHEALSNDDGHDATAMVGSARRLIDRAVGDDAALAPSLELLVEAETLIGEASASLARYLDDIEQPERSLDDVHERRAALTPILRRFGSIDDALEHARTGALRLSELDDDDARVEALRATVERERAATEAAAAVITDIRTKAAAQLQRAVQVELRALAMPDAAIEIAVTPSDRLGEYGADDVKILLAPHPGSDAKPIAKSASGGELSRVMLALEVALAAHDVPTFVFDEVDAGVGGAAAVEIGARLAKLATQAQVVVVTHLAQVAAFASTHVRVVKATDGSVTASSVHEVTGDERLRELARMLAGSDSDTALAHAAELLENAQTGR